MRPRPLLLLLSALAAGSSFADEPLRVGVPVSVGSLPFYAASEQGFFREEGLPLEVTVMPPGPRMIQAVTTGALDFGQTATLSVLNASAAGLDVVIVGPAANFRADGVASNGLVAVARAGVKQVKDLRGRVIAVSSLNSINYLMTVEALAQAGLAAGDVTFREIEFPHMLPALERGQVDAASLAEPYLTALAERTPVTMLANGQDVLGGASMSVFTASRAFAAAHAVELERFRRALRRGVEFCAQHPAEAQRLLARHAGVPEAVAPRIALHLFPTEVTAEMLAPLVALARRHGFLEREPSLARVLDPRLP